jgi:hypothetical protein
VRLGEADGPLQSTDGKDAAMTVLNITARITGEGSMAKYTGGRMRPSRDEIARLAYRFYEARGRCEGKDVDDWLCAEQELARHYQ